MQLNEKIRNEVIEIIKDVISIDCPELSDRLIELGYNSIDITRLDFKLIDNFGVNLGFNNLYEMTIDGIIRLIESVVSKSNKAKYPKIEKEEKGGSYKVSSVQKRMYLMEEINEGGTAYHIPTVEKIKGKLNIEKLRESIEKMIEEHEILRTRFGLEEEEIVQYVEEGNIRYEIEYKEGREEEAGEGFLREFDLKKGPLMRSRVVKTGEEEYLLLNDIHHIIGDGISLEQLWKEVWKIYGGGEVEKAKVQYKEYAKWQRKVHETEMGKEQEAYWEKKLGGRIARLELPRERVREEERGRGEVRWEIEGERYKELKGLMKETGTTLYMVLLGIMDIVLMKYTGEEEIVIGSPVAGRQHSELERAQGVYINTIVMRNKVEEEKKYREFMKEVKATVIEGLGNQDYQFEELIEKLNIKREEGKNPIFDVMVNVQSGELGKREVKGLEIERYMVKGLEIEPKVEIGLEARDNGEGVYIALEYKKEMYGKKVMERMQGHYMKIMEEIIKNPDIQISEIDMLTEEERKEFKEAVKTGREKTILEMFEEKVEKRGEETAIEEGEKKISYRELNRKANELGRRLEERGIGAESIVGVMGDRSIEVLIGIYGIMKAGGAYLPINPKYPKERIEYMIEDSKAKVVLAQSKYKEKLGEGQEVIELEDERNYEGEGKNRENKIGMKDLAYVIYTSGTTGKPKGVMIEQKSLVNRIMWMQEEYELGEGDKILQKTPMSFDVSIWELFWWSISGSKVRVMEEGGEKEPERMAEEIEKGEITTIHFVPSMFEMFLGYIKEKENVKKIRSVKRIFTSGEALWAKQVREFNRITEGMEIELINLYGPTEATVDVSYYKCPREGEIERVPIGKEISNTEMYILDRNKRLVPIGITGEIYISGAGVGRGYINLEEENRERFMENPYRRGERMYRTGDIGRRLEDGNIEYIGRKDNQVKIRGYRIEIEEIEKSLKEKEGIKEAAVIVKEEAGGMKSLCGYIVSEKKQTVKEIKAYLAGKLPEYMIPSQYIEIEKMPVTGSGKADRKALEGKEGWLEGGSEYEETTNETEERLREIWKEVLKREEIGINDNFFDLGGQSLKGIILTTQINKVFGINFTLPEVFRYQSLREMAAAVSKSNKAKYPEIEKEEKGGSYKVSSVQKRMYLMEEINEGGTAYHIPTVEKIKGKLNIEKLRESIEKMIEEHEILRTRFGLEEEEIVQYVEEGNIRYEIEYKEGREEEAGEGFLREFDLKKGPLMRSRVVKTGEEEYLLLNDIHHIIGDGISLEQLWKEVWKIYGGGEVEKAKVQYKEYAKWQRKVHETEMGKEQEAYWEKKLGGRIARLELPRERVREEERGRGEVRWEIEGERYKELKGLMKETGTTLYMVLLGIMDIVLMKYTGEEEIVIGSPVAGRQHSELERAQGVYINTIVMRNKVEEEKKYREFMKEVKATVIEGLGNQDYQFEELIEKLNIKREEGKNPIFDVMVNVQSGELGKREVKGLEIERYMVKGLEIEPKVEIGLEARDNGEGVYIALEYKKEMYGKKVMERMQGHYMKIMEEIIKNPDIQISEIDMLTEEERKEFKEAVKTGREKTILEMFEEKVEKRGEETAIEEGEKKISYRELNRKANELGRRLEERGIGAESIVGVMGDRSIEVLIGIYGIMKAGGAYLPINPKYPKERIEYMIEDSKAKVVLAQSKYKEKLGEGQEVIELEDERNYEGEGKNRENKIGMKDLAYVIYTSGTTGKPKGVMIEQKSLVNRIMWMQEEYELGEGDKILQKTPMSFDVSIWELFWWSISGSKVRVMEEGGEKEPERMAEEIEKGEITTIHFVPSMFEMFLGYIKEKENVKKIRSVKRIFTSGEALWAKQVREFNRITKGMEIELINLYGPTEATVDVSYYKCPREGEIERVPIGKEISNTEMYILDRNKRLVPIGITGEIYISGAGVGRGYINLEEENRERFMENPYRRGERMYRTGDIGRRLEDGNIEYIGRKDNQVKIRGYRIEIEEIEKSLKEKEGIKEAAVIVKEEAGGMKSLCGYIVSEKKQTVKEIKAYLAGKLPEYMIPSQYIEIEKMPVTGSGKADRKALEGKEGWLEGGSEYEETTNETEERLREIWKEVLKREEIGINDNFFDLGGQSLKGIILTTQINKVFGINFTLPEVFRYPVLKTMAKQLFNSERYSSYLNIMGEPNKTGIFAFPPIFGYGTVYTEIIENFHNHTIYSFDFIESTDRVSEYGKMIKNLQKDGLYILLAYSAGGNLALEVAQYLEQSINCITKVILIDSYINNHLGDKKFSDDDYINEISHYVQTDMYSESELEVLINKMKSYEEYVRHTDFNSKVKAELHLIISDRRDEAGIDYDKFTVKEFKIHAGKGDHYNMILGESGKYNAEIINRILKY